MRDLPKVKKVKLSFGQQKISLIHFLSLVDVEVEVSKVEAEIKKECETRKQ